MREVTKLALRLPRGEKKQRAICQLEKDSQVLFRSDASKYPSYTQLNLPYHLVCRQRYVKVIKMRRRQCKEDLRTMELMQSKALDGIKIHRVFSEGFQLPASLKISHSFTPEERRLHGLLEEGRKLN